MPVVGDWTEWSWLAPVADTYRLQLRLGATPMATAQDEVSAFFDAIEVIEAGSTGSTIAPVTEPATMLLLGAGLLGIVGVKKKFTKC